MTEKRALQLQRPFLIFDLDFRNPHLLAGCYVNPITAAAAAAGKQFLQISFCTALQAGSPPGNSGNGQPGSFQRCAPAAGLKTEFDRLRHNAAQPADFHLQRSDPLAAGMLQAQIDDALGYGQFMHNRAPRTQFK